VATLSAASSTERFAGEVLVSGDPGYDEARALWNGDVDRRPKWIVRCEGVRDVVECVRVAREEELPLSVRSGGHGVGGHALVDDGLVVDLSAMRGIRVDPVRRTVRAQAGVLLGELDRECQAFRLATPAGIVTTTGLAGLTLGGGIGWLMRKHGATVDNLLSIDLVTAHDAFVTADTATEAELFWGLRGGGGNFGIATSFEYALHEVGPVVLCGLVGYAHEDGRDVLRAYADAVADAPDELTTILTLRRVPALPLYPEEHHGRLVVNVAVCYAGDLGEGERVVGPLRRLGTPLYDLLAPRQFVEHQRMFDASVPRGWNYYWKTWEVPRLTDDAIDGLVDATVDLPTLQSYVIVFQLGGAIARVPEDETAYPQRVAGFNVNINGVWLPGAEREPTVRWVRDLHAALEPLAGGRAYVNFLGDEGADGARRAYGPEKYERLVALKDRWDPDNLFRSNQNIVPSAARN
jgi:FAD/FMN-containing dehydrogenase